MSSRRLQRKVKAMRHNKTAWLTAVVGISATALANSSDAPKSPGPSEVRSTSEASEYFGPITRADWTGILTVADQPMPFDLHWIEANYTAYDIDQSRNRFAGQGEFAAVLVLSDRNVTLFGKRLGAAKVSLVDVELLINPDHMHDVWLALADHVTAVTQAGGTDSKGQQLLVLKGPDGSTVDISLSARNATGLKLESPVTQPLQPQLRNPGAVKCSTWIGELAVEDDAIHESRVVLIEVQNPSLAAPNNAATVAMATWRTRERRLAGPVGPDCHWPTKASFVHTLQDLKDAKVYWYAGEFDADVAGPVLEKQIGVRLNKDEFFREIDSTFGSRQKAVAAICPFAEMRHMALTLVRDSGVDGDRFIGAAWNDKFDKQVRRVVNSIDRMTPLPTAGNTCTVKTRNCYIAPDVVAHTSEYVVSLRRLEDSSKTPEAPSP